MKIATYLLALISLFVFSTSRGKRRGQLRNENENETENEEGSTQSCGVIACASTCCKAGYYYYCRKTSCLYGETKLY